MYALRYVSYCGREGGGSVTCCSRAVSKALPNMRAKLCQASRRRVWLAGKEVKHRAMTTGVVPVCTEDTLRIAMAISI